MTHINTLRKKYDATFVRNKINSYDCLSSTHRGAILAFCLHYNAKFLENWMNNKWSDRECSGFYMEYVKRDGLICLYGDDIMFEETPEIPVCLSPQILRSLFTQIKKLISEKTPAITLHWENDTPVLTPWYDVDLSWGTNTPKDSDTR